MYVNVTDDPLIEVNRVPPSARRIDSGEWVLGLRDASADVQQATGWYQVVEVARPADTATDTFQRTVELVNGVPTVVWTQRPWTTEELAARTAFANQATLTTQVADNIATLLTSVTALNEITARTNATINANPAATIKDLTRELKTVARQTIRVARLVARQLDTTDSGT